ncbi:proton-coupled folate transporter-like isoform X2 [Colias croceus]|uniref:proton-coupled folate transporter-like isoform X2 n=2 Tax=Colias crocea TaxID=72248 RepID=UPI001E27E38C|nr:proton-coupled folate transporter-like isoform X2 [Colias croceus]
MQLLHHQFCIITDAALSNIFLYRTCVHALNYTEAECRPYLSPIKNNETSHLEAEVQKYATLLITVKMILEAVVPAFLSFFLGAWSDTYGRKPLIAWTILGSSITSMLLVLYGLLDNLGPWWYIVTIIPFSITGGFRVLLTGVYCYVSDITSKENTSLRMTMIDAATTSGSVIGSLLSSYLILSIGNVYLLLLAALLNVFAYGFTKFFIKESLNGSIQGGFTRVLDLLHVKDMFRESFKRRPNNGRMQIILIAMAQFLLMSIMYGIMPLEYLFTRQQLQWSLQDYTIYSAVSTSISFVGGFLGVMVVQKLLRLGDISFTIFGLLTCIIEYILKILAFDWLFMYLGSLISIFKGLSSVLLRSFISKTFPRADVAKIFALICAFESFAPLAVPLVYNTVYAMTVATLPGAIYILSIVFVTASIIMLGFVQYFHWRATRITYNNCDSPDA